MLGVNGSRPLATLTFLCLVWAQPYSIAMAMDVPRAAQQGGSWNSIKHLPDWSGVWQATSYKKHMLGHGRAPYRDLNVPFNDVTRPLYEKYKAIAYAGGTFASRADRCTTFGMPGVMDHPVTLLQFLYTPGQVTIIAPEFWRVIYTDGRAHNDAFTTFQGDSVGYWLKDDTLVVDTRDLDPGDEFILGIAQGKDSHVVERIRRTGKDSMVDDVTFEAPAVLSATYHYQITFERRNEPVIEEDCAQANRDIDPNTGDKAFDITPPPN